MEPFTKEDLKKLSDCLNDKETTLKMANSIIGQIKTNTKDQSIETAMMEVWARFVLNKNIDEIFASSQSPIERIFLNSVLFFGLMHDTRMIIFTPRNISIPNKIKEFKTLKAFIQKITKQIVENNPAIAEDEITEELLRVVEESCDKAFYDFIFHHHLLYNTFGLANSFHFTLQNTVTDLKTSSRKIRPDITIWMPENKNFKILVECDGFKWHSSKEAFSRDRQKDRELTKNGYKVFRYSGTEIYNSPVETGWDLCNHLFEIRKNKKLDEKLN